MAANPRYPELTKYLDSTAHYEVETEERQFGDSLYLIVIERGEIESGQMLFEITDHGLELRQGDIFDSLEEVLNPQIAAAPQACSMSSSADHQRIHEWAVQNVNSFSSIKGPDGGNLACCWAVRHLAYLALRRWITKTDSTATFDRELQRCFSASTSEADVPPGGIVISPTASRADGTRNIGHVGLLGEGHGGTRLIYSNSSSRKRWEQNHTLDSWHSRYQTGKGLPVKFYPLPSYQLA